MKSVAAILVAICLAHFQDVNANVKVLHKSRMHSNNIQIVFERGSYTDKRLTYALCDNNPKFGEINCTVIREKKPYEDDSYSCNVTLKRIENYNICYAPKLSIFPFGNHYAALNVRETNRNEKIEYLNFTTVQLDSCKVVEAAIHTRLPLSNYDFTVVGHSDSYDVFYKSDKISCANKTCKATINADGQLVNEPSPSIGTYYQNTLRPIVSLNENSPSKGYFYINVDGDEHVQSLVKHDGTEKSLAKHPKPSGEIAVSKNNNLIGVCYQSDSGYNCSQYDFDGNVKMQATISRGYKDGMQLLDVYNLPNGGFYVFSQECSKLYPKLLRECIGDRTGLLIERLDANGKKTGSLNFQGFNTTFTYQPVVPLFYENETKDTCLSLVVSIADSIRTGLELTANCFTEADFSN